MTDNQPEHDAEPKKYETNAFGFIPLEDQVQSPIHGILNVLAKMIDGPTSWFREKVVLKYRGPAYPYYHRKFRRVPTVDQCYNDDMACVYEADEQYKRDRKVDFEIAKILRQRYYRCHFYERNINEWDDAQELCLKERAVLAEADMNLFIKYGELGAFANVMHAFMKQKHRLIFERRQREKEEKAKQ